MTRGTRRPVDRRGCRRRPAACGPGRSRRPRDQRACRAAHRRSCRPLRKLPPPTGAGNAEARFMVRGHVPDHGRSKRVPMSDRGADRARVVRSCGGRSADGHRTGVHRQHPVNDTRTSRGSVHAGALGVQCGGHDDSGATFLSYADRRVRELRPKEPDGRLRLTDLDRPATTPRRDRGASGDRSAESRVDVDARAILASGRRTTPALLGCTSMPRRSCGGAAQSPWPLIERRRDVDLPRL